MAGFFLSGIMGEEKFNEEGARASSHQVFIKKNEKINP